MNRQGEAREGLLATSYPGVYPYATKTLGVLYRATWRDSSGEWESKRGFTSETAANNYRIDRVAESRRGERPASARDAIEEHWPAFIASLHGRIVAESEANFERDWKLRIAPTLGDLTVREFTPDRVNEAVRVWADAGLAPHTVNNTIGTLSTFATFLLDGRGLRQNPCSSVRRLPVCGEEMDWLRLHEIPLYLEGCSDVYRPIARHLIRTGDRISECLAHTLSDLEHVHDGIVHVVRSWKGAGATLRLEPTKGKRRRAVAIGPEYADELVDRASRIAEHSEDPRNALLFAMPTATSYLERLDLPDSPPESMTVREARAIVAAYTPRRGRPPRDVLRAKAVLRGEVYADPRVPVAHRAAPAPNMPVSRTVVSRDWHKAALSRAGLRDMELHCLRHTAAAIWLQTGHSLEFVMRQLGHRDLSTTRIYEHLEHGFQAQRAAQSERLLREAEDRRSAPLDFLR